MSGCETSQLRNVRLRNVSAAKSIDEATVERAKRSLLTNLLLMLDGSTPVCEDIGRQLLCYGRRIPTPELTARVEAITVDEVKDVVQRIFVQGQISATVVGPTGQWPARDQIQAKLAAMV
uniref:Mitochondrial-processing peptidase subunit alpha n=1 Tax=Caenorhabditis japonica TaxID=281687 RepID=A0A8R1HS75_CAEJA